MWIKSLVSCLLICLMVGCGASNDVAPENEANTAVATQPADAASTRVEPDACTKRCRKRAGGQYKACIAEGGDAVECREQAGTTSRSCVTDRCGGTPAVAAGEVDPCKAGCAKLRLGYDTCLEGGGTEEACREETGQAVRTCLAEC